jgi:hypothetical protein
MLVAVRAAAAGLARGGRHAAARSVRLLARALRLTALARPPTAARLALDGAAVAPPSRGARVDRRQVVPGRAVALDEIGDAQATGAVLHRAAAPSRFLGRLLRGTPMAPAIAVRIMGGGVGAAWPLVVRHPISLPLAPTCATALFVPLS